ncbi:putative E3 ubiquitin-protein ligase LIN [Impatiens glandulifera]|uniref:putative E3 ubiquitin-protein ligase LIN n=1 Tax=Impatiens glandulifera TaxID=253017 RepID=UPI001FB07673|nr:putative E3 ubiquitin-protein ligase LIN [Impatiens glandulifera]
MASSSSPSIDSLDQERPPSIESIQTIVHSITHHIQTFLSTPKSRRRVKTNCTSKLNNLKQDFFEFSEQSVLSNLYWGIQGIEAAIIAKCPEELSNRLKNSEEMLQAPALLEEHGVTAGVSNAFLVSCSYFYLSAVRKLQGDNWQSALHFLQALSVSPIFTRTEFAPELCTSLLMSSRSSEIMDDDDDEINKLLRRMARRYKAWLTYYQVMSYKGSPHQHQQEEEEEEEDELLLNNNKSVNTQSSNSRELENIFQGPHKVQELTVTLLESTQVSSGGISSSSNTGRLGDILKENQSDVSVSGDSNDSYFKEDVGFELTSQKIKGASASATTSERYFSSFSLSELPIFDLKCKRQYPSENSVHRDEKLLEKMLQQNDAQIFDSQSSSSSIMQRKTSGRDLQQHGKDSQYELMTILEKTVSKLCFSNEKLKFDEDYSFEFVRIYGLLSKKKGVKYTLLKDVILNQLLTAISTSEEVALVRASVSILTTLVSGNKSVIEDVKKKGLQLHDLANALKRNVHEAVILIYLTNPSPVEIKTLELLPSLLDIVCTNSNTCCKGRLDSLLPTPPAASLMIIEVLVTGFDYATNKRHLAAINVPRVLAGLLDIQRYNNTKEYTSLATILVRCMQFDGQCRKYISEFTPVAPFLYLLSSSQEHARSIALEYFHELLQMPRSSANKLLRRMLTEGSINTMHTLMLLIQKSQHEHKLLSAFLLLQLDMLESSSGKSIYREEALEHLLEPLKSSPGSAGQQLSAFLMSSLGGTYSWTGEPYTVAWLLKKTGLTTCHHRNMIRNFNWLDESMQDAATDLWCRKIARILIKTGVPVFRALENGLKSGTKKVSRDCLAAMAWIGCEIGNCPEDLRHEACDILLRSEVQQFLHPGVELEERLLACLCIYSYASGKGMQKLIHFSEGVRESLRRLSTITWMAEELLRVADYFHPNKWRISCVHTQVVEAGQKNNGAVTALIYYKGQLYSGYNDGSIKGWEIKGQTATLISDMKEHRKAITCLSLFEAGDCLLSASMDRTIRMWQMVQSKLECIEVIGTKEPIQSLDSYRKQILGISLSHEMKVFDTSSTEREVTMAKNVKCLRVVRGKVYIGCMDSSIREIDLSKNKEREIKAPFKVWRMQSRPISSIAVYKDLLYCSSLTVEGSSIKEWRRQSKPRITIVPEGGTHVRAMEIVEDFIYLNCNQSPSTLQIWLRGTQQKVGRISAGKKITSLLAANDMILCGTETGVIKGWIPL